MITGSIPWAEGPRYMCKFRIQYTSALNKTIRAPRRQGHNPLIPSNRALIVTLQITSIRRNRQHPQRQHEDQRQRNQPFHFASPSKINFEGALLLFTIPYVSPFVGRLDDISSDGIELVSKIVDMYTYYGYSTQVLAASIRTTQHIIQCIEVGADVATCPLAAIKGLLNHPLTNSGLAKFLEDYKKVND